MDEIQDIDGRETALQAILEGAAHPDWRFVVTSRPLPTGDIEAACTVFTACELQPFDDKGLFTFAERWFARRPELPNAPELAKRLQRHVQDKDLRRLAHTPLAAAMLCVLLAEAPEQPCQTTEQCCTKGTSILYVPAVACQQSLSSVSCRSAVSCYWKTLLRISSRRV